MFLNNSSFDISDEFSIYRCGFGFKLGKSMSGRQRSANGIIIADLMKSLYGIFIADASDLSLLKVNNTSAEHCGFDSPNFAVGKTAFDFMDKNCAASAQDLDQKVLISNRINMTEYSLQRLDGSVESCFAIRSPLYNNENKIMGVIGFNVQLGKQPLLDSLTEFKKLGLIQSDFQPNNNPYPGSEIDNIYFSKREIECLHEMVEGKTAKQIAEKLGLSIRTIQNYQENIKQKLNVSTKKELLEKVFEYFQ